MSIRCLFMGVNILSFTFLASGEESVCIKPGSSYVCLSGGSGSHEGNVYVNGKPVCDDNWDIKDGNVVCKQLNFQRGAVQVFTKTHFSEYMSGIFGMDEVECNGNEDNITNCYHSKRDDCGPGEAAGVLCDNSSPELVEREAQLIRDCYAEDVGYSSRDKMAEEKAVALATQCQDWCVETKDCLQFSFDKTTKICSRYSGNTKVPRDDFISGPRDCPPQDLDINCTSAIVNADCTSMGVANCSVCLKSSDNDLQIEEHIGNVFVNNKAVCDDEWDMVDGHVLCKQLGFPGGARAIYSGSKYGLVLSEFSMDNVDCSGTEQSLTNCSYTKTDNCDSGEAAGVVCDHREDFIIAREKECFINDLTYSTDNHIPGEDVAEFPNKCQSLCSNVEGCSHFTWFMDGHKCLFFNRTGVDNGKLKEMGAVSGPRKCPDIPIPEGCNSDEICLVGGNYDEGYGNVMVRRQPVCDDDWDLLDAHIACKQLGFQRATGFTRGSKYGLMPRIFSLDNLNCTGNEITLDHCQHADIEDCDSNEGAGVICDRRNEKTIRDEGDLMTEQCFVKDVVYGSLLSNDFIYLPTVMDCQLHCINDSECSTFSYNNQTEECQKRKSVSTSSVPQCSASSYEVLDDYWRKIDYSSRRSKSAHCDDYLQRKWYRLLGPAGTRLPTSQAPTGSPTYDRNYCGTHGTAYMTEDHPAPEQGIVSRTVCFEWEDNSCILSTNIQVAACYDNNEDVYYVYELTPPSSCNHAYCGLEGLGDSSGSAPSLCEDGWTHFGDHCYFLSNVAETFDEAKQECETMLPGSTLVSINSFDEQEFLKVNMVGSRWYYIGLHRVNSEWKWLDGSPITYENWKSGEPNNYGGSDYSAVMNRRASSYGQWFDNAGDVDMHYICKTTMEDISLSATGGGKKFRDPSESIISGPTNCNAPPPTFDKVECSKPGAVCLDGGSSPYEGNVYLEGKPVCDDQWNLKSADIVCSQLQFGKAKNTTGQSTFGQVTGPFAMTNVRCIGNEKTIKDCSHETEIKCIGAEAAGVRCETLVEKEMRVQKERELKECFLKGMCYDAGMTIGDYIRTESLKSCQELCVDHPECKFFTFYTDSTKCYRRRGNNKESCSDAISGPRSCHKVHDAIRITDNNCTTEGQICLRGGNKTSEGNVFIGGKPVCDDSWSLTDGDVACRQLGYAGVKRITVASHFGYVSGEFSLDDVYCDGSESNLTMCQTEPGENCAGDEGAGVVCDTRSPEKIKQETRKLKHCFMLDVFVNGTALHTELDVESAFDCQDNCTSNPECTFFLYNSEEQNCTILKDEDSGTEKSSYYGMVAGPRECIWTEDDCSCNGSSICLCGGSGPHEGNVFIEVEGKAKPVCDDHWNLVNADLICKQLNFVQALNFTTKSHFGNVSYEFSMDNVFCKGYEDNITYCHTSEEENCDGSEAAGVICDTRSQGVIDAENRLVEQNCFIDHAYYGESMRIRADDSLRNERRYPDSYEYVYLPSSVACQMLCSTTEECQTFRYRASNKKCYLRRKYLNNDGSDNKYTSSDYISGPKQCENSDPVFSNPNCLNKNVVCLSGGSGTHDGNVFFEGKPVCDDMWSLSDALVVCKQLGYCIATRSTLGSTFGSVKGPFAFNEVECSGSEHNINECRSISKVKCLKSEAAGVICEHFAETLEQGGCEGRPRPTPPPQQDCDRRDAVCLKGGSSENEGNVYVSGKPVCDDSWGTVDGEVVCKQLGFPGIEKTTRESFFGSTSSVFSMDEVGCRGEETKITDCSFDPSDDCGGSEAAGVVCNARLFPLPQGDTCDNQGVVCLKGGVNQNEGNVMVSGAPVCDDEWDIRDGDVVCKQLGFSGVENVTTKSHFGRESSTFAMDDVVCSGTETQLADCRHNSRDDCGGDEAAGVICLPASEAPEPMQQPACGVLRINDSSSVFTRNDLFGAHNVLENDCDSFHWYSSNQTNYWLAPAGQVGHFIADLGCIYVIDAFQIKNTHNAQQNDRGTREFKISFSNSSIGPWKVLVENEELSDVRNLTCDYGLTNFSVLYPEHERTGQFVKFSVVSWYGDGGGLQFFNVIGHPLGSESSSSGATIVLVVVAVVVVVVAAVGVIYWWMKKGRNTANIPTLPSMYNRGASETKEGILSQTSVDSFSEIAARNKEDKPLA